MNADQRARLNAATGQAATLALALPRTLAMLTPEEARELAAELTRHAYAVERGRDDGMPDAYSTLRYIVATGEGSAMRLALRIGRTD